jgi:hypothetical protein
MVEAELALVLKVPLSAGVLRFRGTASHAELWLPTLFYIFIC